MEYVHKILLKLANPWVLFGFSAQFIFMMRFVIQWIASERRQRSHVPLAFWYLSLVGGVMLFVYAAFQADPDPVFVFGQGLGVIIYIRNLVLIYRRKSLAQKHLDARAASRSSLIDDLLEDGIGDDSNSDGGKDEPGFDSKVSASSRGQLS